MRFGVYFFTFKISSAEQFKKVHSLERVDSEGCILPDKYCEIVGLDMNAAKEAFAEYLTDTSLDSRQIYFVNQIVEYIVHNGLMKDMSVLLDAPFTDNGSIVEVFTDMSVWLGIKRIIDRINANALAA